MRVAVVGLGYVGTVTAACLAENGHVMVGVDVNAVKVGQINNGQTPISELGVAELIAANVARHRLSATQDVAGAISKSDVVIVCVGTPTGPQGDVYLDDVLHVMTEIGEGLQRDDLWRLVLITSTVPPGTVEGCLIPALQQASGKVAGVEFGVAFAPEFLREGSAVSDFAQPLSTVIGTSDQRSAQVASDLLGVHSEHLTTTSVSTAESVKFVANAWHALKVAYSNEVGRFCQTLGVDSQEVMRIFKLDTRLNVSSTYLSPGFAFGGSCLPKDLRTFTHRARVQGAVVPVLDAVLTSNQVHLDEVVRRILSYGARRIALLGLAFKSGTDDLRESPSLELAERLLGKGISLTVHDEHVRLSRLIGVNRSYILERLPHIAELLREDLAEAVGDAELIVVAQGSAAYGNVTDLLQPGQTVLDLTGIARPSTPRADYAGLLW